MSEIQHSDNCTALVENYGVCSRPKDHIVHAMLGISPVEHPYHRELRGPLEEMKLSRRNIKKIARRSGKSVDELEVMRQVAKKKGRQITVRYEVVENADN